jgi:hypothetical protein
MEYIPLCSIPFHPNILNPNNRMIYYFISYHSIPSNTTNPNIALEKLKVETEVKR